MQLLDVVAFTLKIYGTNLYARSGETKSFPARQRCFRKFLLRPHHLKQYPVCFRKNDCGESGYFHAGRWFVRSVP